MQKTFVRREYRIAAGRAWSLRDPAAFRLRVLEGRLWITAAGSADDHWLAPGEELDLASARRVVVEADGSDGAFEILLRAPETVEQWAEPRAEPRAGQPGGLRRLLRRASRVLRRRLAARTG